MKAELGSERGPWLSSSCTHIVDVRGLSMNFDFSFHSHMFYICLIYVLWLFPYFLCKHPPQCLKTHGTFVLLVVFSFYFAIFMDLKALMWVQREITYGLFVLFAHNMLYPVSCMLYILGCIFRTQILTSPGVCVQLPLMASSLRILVMGWFFSRCDTCTPLS